MFQNIYHVDLHFMQRRQEFFLHTLCLPCFSRMYLTVSCATITNIGWDILNPTWLENNLPSFEYFRKIAMTTSLQKDRKGRESSPWSLLIRYNTHTFWITTSTFQTNGYHHHYFHSDNNPVLGHSLAHSVYKTRFLVVTEELNWLLFLNLLSFNFVLRLPVVVITNHTTSASLLCQLNFVIYKVSQNVGESTLYAS